MTNEYLNILALEKFTNIWTNEYICLNIFEYIRISEYSSHIGPSVRPSVSRVTCHVSHITCHMSHVTLLFILFFSWQCGEAYRWRVCYQRGLSCLVCLLIVVYQTTPQSQSGAIFGHLNNHCVVFKGAKHLSRKNHWMI